MDTYVGGLPLPTPGDRPASRIEPVLLASPALAGRFFTTSTTQEPQNFRGNDKSQGTLVLVCLDF